MNGENWNKCSTLQSGDLTKSDRAVMGSLGLGSKICQSSLNCLHREYLDNF